MANKNDYVADRRLYLDKAGKVVEANDKTKQSLLVAEGGTLSQEDALKYGLVSTEGKAEAPMSTKIIDDKRMADAEDKSSESNSDDLEALTVVDLKERAKEMGLTGYSTMNKAELIEAIEAGPEEEGEE